MKNAFYETATGIATAIALFASGVALGHIVNRLPIASGDAATWTGALLTGLAFGGTIWIAITGDRMRAHQARLRAQIAGAALFYEVATLYQQLVSVLNNLEIYQTMDRGEDYYRDCRNEINEFHMWIQTDLEPLVDVDPNIVGALIYTANGIRLAQKGFSNFESRNEPGQRIAFMLGTRQILSTSHESLTKAMVGLEKYRGVEAGNLRPVHAAAR